MSNVMPHFKFHYVDISGKRTLCIEAAGRILYEIPDQDEFYRIFGYRDNPAAQPDMLPDEFIWMEYVNNSSENFNSCIQAHILEYLKAHSISFNREFGPQCDQWLAEHAQSRAQSGVFCVACRRKMQK